MTQIKNVFHHNNQKYLQLSKYRIFISNNTQIIIILSYTQNYHKKHRLKTYFEFPLSFFKSLYKLQVQIRSYIDFTFRKILYVTK